MKPNTFYTKFLVFNSNDYSNRKKVMYEGILEKPKCKYKYFKNLGISLTCDNGKFPKAITIKNGFYKGTKNLYN